MPVSSAAQCWQETEAQMFKSRARRRAVIDVGTNSVKLLVAEINGGQISPILEDSKQTRLGHGFYETHILQPEPIAKTAKAVKKFAEKALDLKAEKICVIATSAARDARNASELSKAIWAASGLELEVLSGEQEAEWVFRGVASDPAFHDLPLLIVDMGGGSSEFIAACQGKIVLRKSFKLGTVRLYEQFLPGDPPGIALLEKCRRMLDGFFASDVTPELKRALSKIASRTSPTLIGTGGTATILARLKLRVQTFERSQLEGTRISLADLKREIDRQWQMPLAERKKLPGMPPKRADIVIFGLVIYETLMLQLGFDSLRVSTRGLRFAALLP